MEGEIVCRGVLSVVTEPQVNQGEMHRVALVEAMEGSDHLESGREASVVDDDNLERQ